MDILQIISSNVPATQSVAYSCVLTNKWSGATHPVEYPSNAHWTAPVLVSHSSGYEVWSPGTLASPGVEAVAEGGVTSVIQGEVGAAQIERKAGKLVIGRNQFNSVDPPQVLESILLSPEFPYLSTISMAGPSPDWFSGIYNFNPVDTAQEYWYQSFKIATYPWDAGTEQGEIYSTNNEPESPHLPIIRLTKDTVPDSGIFLDPTGTKVLPVALWNCNIDSTSGGTRGLFEQAPSGAPIGNTRGLFGQAPTEVPSSGTRGLFKEKAPTEAPIGDTRGLFEQAPIEVPNSGTRGLFKEEAPTTEAPMGDTRGLLKQDPPTEVPNSGTRSLSKQEAPTEAPNRGATRGLLKEEAPTEAPSRGFRSRMKEDANTTESPIGGTRGLFKQDPTEAPSRGTRGLFKEEAPTEAPGPQVRGLRGTRK